MNRVKTVTVHRLEGCVVCFIHSHEHIFEDVLEAEAHFYQSGFA
jgi:hypothetical protein